MSLGEIILSKLFSVLNSKRGRKFFPFRASPFCVLEIKHEVTKVSPV